MPAPLPPHLQWLVENRGEALVSMLANQGVQLESEQAIRVLASADPSPGLHAVQWLCDTMLSGGYLWEDVAAGAQSKAGETLAWFAQHRQGLPRGQRKLEEHRSLASVYRAVQPLLQVEQEPSSRELRRRVRAQAIEESIVLCHSSDLVVAVPLTQEASRWWGRGTRWCTAADKSNYFDRYDNKAPLIVIVLPKRGSEPGPHDGGKLQLYLERNEDGSLGAVTFMDAADESVDPGFVDQHWDELEGVLTWALEGGHDLSDYIPPTRWRGRVGELVMATGYHLHNIPMEARTHGICRAAVGYGGSQLSHVPLHMRDADICMHAVHNSGFALEHVPQDLVTEELCMAAVKSTGQVIHMVPRHLQSPAMYQAAVGQYGHALRHIEPHLRTRELCLTAVKNSGDALGDVADNLWDHEMMLAAVSNCGDVLDIIPREMRTPDVLLAAVCNSSYAIRYLEKDEITPEICMAMVVSNPSALAQIPHPMRTHAVCKQSLLGGSRMLSMVPKDVLDAELCTIAVASSRHMLRIVPDEFKTRQMCLDAVINCGRMIEFIPHNLIDEEICLAAVQQEAWSIRRISPQHLTHKIWIAAVSGDPQVICMMPKPQSLAICVHAVSREAATISYVDPYIQEQVLASLQTFEPPLPQLPPPRKWSPAVALAGLAECLAMRQVAEPMQYLEGDEGRVSGHAANCSQASMARRDR